MKRVSGQPVCTYTHFTLDSDKCISGITLYTEVDIMGSRVAPLPGGKKFRGKFFGSKLNKREARDLLEKFFNFREMENISRKFQIKGAILCKGLICSVFY